MSNKFNLTIRIFAAVPLVIAVNAVVAGVLSLPFWSVWDSVTVAALLVSAFTLFTK